MKHKQQENQLFALWSDKMERDLLIIGGGPGGYVAAIKAAQLGAKVALVEKERLGGVCLNWGCIPTKTMLKTAKLYDEILRSEEFGIMGVKEEDLKVDWEKLLGRKDQVVNRLVSGIELLFKKNKVDLFQGEGKVLDKNQGEANGETLKTDKLILATGARSYFPEIKGLKESLDSGKTINYKGVLSLEDLPEEIVIIGNNNYALEFATLFSSLGSKTTLIHSGDRILPYIEKEMAKTLERDLKKKGLKIVPKAEVKSISDDGILVEAKGKEKTYNADKYLVTFGLRPRLEGLEKLDLDLDSKNFIKTNEKLETNIEGVYAIGDVNGKNPLAHVASAEGIVAVENIMGQDSSLDYKLVPQVIYSFPELASVGLTEEEAKESDHDISVSKFPLMANGKALAEGETVGFVKIISDNEYGEIIGTHIMADHASDMISKVVAIMQLEGTVYDLAKTIHPHPTTSEIFMEAAFGAIDKPIHM